MCLGELYSLLRLDIILVFFVPFDWSLELFAAERTNVDAFRCNL